MIFMVFMVYLLQILWISLKIGNEFRQIRLDQILRSDKIQQKEYMKVFSQTYSNTLYMMNYTEKLANLIE